MRLDDEQLRTKLRAPDGSWRTREGLRDSAVLIVLVERDGADHVVFQRRRDHLDAHAGEICFPGGGRQGDEDAVSCALRETSEEMGLDPAGIEVLGRLPDRVSIAGFVVAAFVGRLGGLPDYRLLEEEVAEVFEVPVAALRDQERWWDRPVSHPLAQFDSVPCFDWGGRVIWGLTGIILTDFLKRVGEGE